MRKPLLCTCASHCFAHAQANALRMRAPLLCTCASHCFAHARPIALHMRAPLYRARPQFANMHPGCLRCRGARTSTSPRCLSSAARLDNRALTAPCGTCSCSPQVFTIDSRQSWDRSSNSECLPTFPNSLIKMQIGETVAMDPLNAVAYKHIIMKIGCNCC